MRCSSLTQRGLPCRAYPLHGGYLCLFHAPELAVFRWEHAKIGGIYSGAARRRKRAAKDTSYILQVSKSIADPSLRAVVEVAVRDELRRRGYPEAWAQSVGAPVRSSTRSSTASTFVSRAVYRPPPVQVDDVVIQHDEGYSGRRW